MYRKILALLLVCVMLLSVVGCRKKNKDNDESVPQTTAATDETGEAFPTDDLNGACLDGTNTEATEPKVTLSADVKIDIGVTPSPDDDDDIDDPINQTSEPTKPGNDKTEDTKPGSDNTEDTKPGKNETEDEKPGSDETDPATPGDDETEPVPEAPDLDNPTAEDYEWYIGLSGSEQSAFVESFLPNVGDFFTWYNAAKEAYDEIHGGQEIGGGAIDGGNIG